MATSEDIQKLYIAYFGRPADPDGLAFYLASANQRFNGEIRPILSEFFDSLEYKSLYNFDVTQAAGRRDAVNQVYTNLLNRTADPEGLAFYTNKLAQNPAQGLSLLVLDVLNGARGIDADTIQNKLVAASVFTQQLDTVTERNSYNGNRAVIITREYLSGIDGNTLFLPQENGENLSTRADTFINRLVSEVGPGAATSDLVFTNLRDTLLGTNAAESTNASLRYVNGTLDTAASTLNSGDSLDMKGGNDTLTLSVVGNRLPASNTFNLDLANTENLVIDNREADPARSVAFNLNDSTGSLANLSLVGARLGNGFDSSTTINGLKQLVDVAFTVQTPGTGGSAPTSTPELNSQINSANRQLILGFDAAAVASNADVLRVRIDGVDFANVLANSSLTLAPQLTNFKLSAAGIETLFVENVANNAGGAPVPPSAGTVQAPLIKTLILGEASSSISRIAVVENNSQVFRVDASAIGNTVVEFDGTRASTSQGNALSSLVLDIGSGLRAGQTLRGGNSVTDVLVISSPSTLNQATLDSISQFETLRLDTSSTQALNVRGVRGLRTVELRGSSSGDTFTVNNVQFDQNGTVLPEVVITRETNRINGLTANLTTETPGNVDQVFTVGVNADMAKLNISNSRNVELTTQLPFVKDFIEDPAGRKVIDNLELTGASTLSVDLSRDGLNTIELGSITTDVLRTLRVTELVPNGQASALLMNGAITKSVQVGVDIIGGRVSDRIFGSNQADTINGGGGADLINLVDGTTSIRDRVIFEQDAQGGTGNFGDTIINFRATPSSNTSADNDVLVLTRALVFGTSDAASPGQVQFGPTTTTTTTPGLLGVGGTTTTTVTPDSRIKILTGSAGVGSVDANDVIVALDNAARNALGLSASDLEAPGLAKLTAAVNLMTTAASSQRFILFVSNDVDVFGYQFARTIADDPATTTVDETTFANRSGSTPMVRLIGLGNAGVLDQTDFELIG